MARHQFRVSPRVTDLQESGTTPYLHVKVNDAGDSLYRIFFSFYALKRTPENMVNRFNTEKDTIKRTHTKKQRGKQETFV